jgi:hypothetical protein
MDWQLLGVGVLVAGAAVYLGQQTLRTWIGKKSSCGGCGGGCGKPTAPTPPGATLIPVEELRLRPRSTGPL